MAKRTAKLTGRVVTSSAPETAKFFLWDTMLPSFGLRVMPSGTKSYVLRYRVGKGRRAKERMITLGKSTELTCEAARRLAKDYKAEARLGLDPEQERRQEVFDGMNVSDLFESWKRNAAHINRRTGALRKPENIKLDVDRIAIHVLPILGKSQIAELKKADISFLRDEISRGVTSVRKKTKPRGSETHPVVQVPLRVQYARYRVFSPMPLMKNGWTKTHAEESSCGLYNIASVS